MPIKQESTELTTLRRLKNPSPTKSLWDMETEFNYNKKTSLQGNEILSYLEIVLELNYDFISK